jgi:hypothetical protein
MPEACTLRPGASVRGFLRITTAARSLRTTSRRIAPGWSREVLCRPRNVSNRAQRYVLSRLISRTYRSAKRRRRLRRLVQDVPSFLPLPSGMRPCRRGLQFNKQTCTVGGSLSSPQSLAPVTNSSESNPRNGPIPLPKTSYDKSLANSCWTCFCVTKFEIGHDDGRL